jgi:hypothetical protein
MGKPQNRDENVQNAPILLFKAYLPVFYFCPACKKIGGFWVFTGSVAYNHPSPVLVNNKP